MCQSCQATGPGERLTLSPEDILDFTQSKYQGELMRFKEPHFGFWEMTYSCNLRCGHCGLAAGTPRSDELDSAEALAILDNISESDTRYLLLLGGEPLIRKDFIDIAEYASRRFHVSVCTNGILIDRVYAEKMKDAGVQMVLLSLDGATAKTHDSLRGDGAFEKAIQGLENALDAGLHVCIMYAVSKKNLHELPETLKLAQDYDINCFQANDFLPFGRGENISDQALSKEQRESMCKYLAERRLRAESPVASLPDDPFWFIQFEGELMENCFDPLSDFTVIGDTAGILCYGIKPNGKVIPFPTLRIDIGDLRDESLRQIWNNSEVIHTLRERENLRGKCGRCEYKFVCGGNRGVAYHYSGDIMAEDPRCWYEPSLH